MNRRPRTPAGARRYHSEPSSQERGQLKEPPTRRVLLVADDLKWGGRERQLGLLCTNLPESWSASLWSVDGGPYEDVLRDAGIDVWIAGRKHRRDPRFALDLWRTIRHVRPDVVHSWGWMASFAAAPACRFLGIPFVDGSIRNAVTPGRRQILARVNHRLAQRVIANSLAGLRANRIPKDKGRVVYNGFDSTRLVHATEELPGTAGRFKVVMTGRMSPQKDYNTFLEAARILAGLEPDRWSFIAVGGGPDRQSLSDRYADLTERNAVLFPELRDEVIGLVRGCHVGVLLTSPRIHAEGLANSIMEYMACGLPVVCTDSGGNRELVEDGRTGFVIPASDPAVLVQRLLFLRDNPEVARTMGEEGQLRVLRDLSVQQMVSATIRVYEEVCSSFEKA